MYQYILYFIHSVQNKTHQLNFSIALAKGKLGECTSRVKATSRLTVPLSNTVQEMSHPGQRFSSL